jgi:hypothetical protein
MKKTYQGSCHCGIVRFEVDLDLARGTAKCNCSICAKSRWWGTMARPESLRLLAGESELSRYQFNTKSSYHAFCRHCGIKTFVRGYLAELGGEFVSINVACLDNVADTELAALPVSYSDGRNDNWMNPPAETRHL